MMKGAKMDVLENLCSYDKRNPNNVIDEDEPEEPRTNCYCDNCFYGRDKLAEEILRLKDIKEIKYGL
jgi:hypothetical protein